MNDDGNERGHVIKLRVAPRGNTRRPNHRPVGMTYWGLCSGEDGAWIVTIPGIPGCKVWGPTTDSALRLAALAAGEWIRLEQEAGRRMPAPSDASELVAVSEIALALAVDDLSELRRVHVAVDELGDLAGQA